MKKSISVYKYSGNSSVSNSISRLIDRKYKNLFDFVIVHGSIASNDEISYSDFDGLLIIKDEFFHSKDLMRFEYESMKLILKYDPLQHHGWFKIKTSQLKNYPQSYLPHEILSYSKLLFPNQEQKILELEIKTIPNYLGSLNQITRNIAKQTEWNWNKHSTYQLKSFLSKIMLLPSMYYSAKFNEGINKKESFDCVKKDFSVDAWKCIETSTLIRATWNYPISKVRRQIMSHPNRYIRRISKTFVAPKIKQNHLSLLDEDFFESLNMLLLESKINLNSRSE